MVQSPEYIIPSDGVCQLKQDCLLAPDDPRKSNLVYATCVCGFLETIAHQAFFISGKLIFKRTVWPRATWFIPTYETVTIPPEQPLPLRVHTLQDPVYVPKNSLSQKSIENAMYTFFQNCVLVSSP